MPASVPDPGHRDRLLTVALVGVLAAVLVTVFVDFRPGGYLLALVLAGVALTRAFLPVRVVGALAVRARWLDVAVAVVLAASVATLAQVVPHP